MESLGERSAFAENLRATERTRSRFTGRMAILVLVLAVLAVSYASSARAYLHQRATIEAHQQTIAATEERIAELRREKARWEDDDYVAQQARERFGYVRPGETPYVVLDGAGRPLEGGALPDQSSAATPPPPAWYDDLWESTKIAGDPPTEAPEPPSRTIEVDNEDEEDE
jgi:cell division protein FtsB